MKYRPGICNIGIWNRLYRLGIGLFFFTVGVWTWALLEVNKFPQVTKIVLFLPFYLGFLGIYEAILGFCVILARNRKFDMR